MEKLDTKVGSNLSPAAWTPLIARQSQTLTAWAYALGCGKVQVAQGMKRLAPLQTLPAIFPAIFPASFEKHVEAEREHADWLHQAVAQERNSLTLDPAYGLLERVMSQALESYVRTLLGYAERQTICREAQYCTASLALSSRIFRHATELGRQCGSLDLSRALSKIVEEEARHARTAQAVLQTLPKETRGIYRSVRAFEEMLFNRMIRKLFRELDLYERTLPKRPAHSHCFVRCA
jgi:rubrerythrin